MANDSTTQVPGSSPTATPEHINAAAADAKPQTEVVTDPPQKKDRVQDPNQQAGG